MGRQKVDMGALRTDTMVRAGGVCEWGSCREHGEEMAHLEAKGMGGNPNQSRNTLRNTVWLCRWHHDVFDRRVSAASATKFEIRDLLTEYVRLARQLRGRG